MYICACIIYRDVAHTNFARKTLVFRLPPIVSTCELFLLTAWCQLVVLEAYEMQSGGLVPNASSAQIAENVLLDPSLHDLEHSYCECNIQSLSS